MADPDRFATPDPGAAVVVTGIGVVSPAGLGVEAMWDGLLSGRSMAAVHPVLAEHELKVQLACAAPDVDVDALLGRGAMRRLDRFTHLALLAAHEALVSGGLAAERAEDDEGELDFRLLDVVDRDRVGVFLGSGIGGAETWSSEYPNVLSRGFDRASPFFIPRMLSNTAGGSLSIRSGARGPNMTVNTACAAGASAIHMARDLLRSGSADVMLAGGVEAGITPLAVSAFANMGALSKNTDPETASRPFDVDRDGFVMGEGAAVVVLEREEHAAARGATVLGRLLGAGQSADAHHVTAPPEDGGGAILAMRRALDDAGLEPTAIDHVNAHGTSTPANDSAESAAMRAVMGEHLDRVPITSVKGAFGHLLGAAGALEAVAALLTLRDEVVPPTSGTRQLDPAIDLDVVLDDPRKVADVRTVLSTSFGFGGQNAALLLGAP